MYPPAVSYEIYRLEHGIAVSKAERRAVDDRAGQVAAALGQQWQSVTRALTLAGPRQAWHRWKAVNRRASSPGAPRPLRSSAVRTISTHGIVK